MVRNYMAAGNTAVPHGVAHAFEPYNNRMIGLDAKIRFCFYFLCESATNDVWATINKSRDVNM